MRNCGNCDYCAENGEDLVCVNKNSGCYGDLVTEDYVCCGYEGTEPEDEEDLK